MLLKKAKTISSVSILVIDDEFSILKMISLILTRQGYKVDTAGSGEEGIKKINRTNYDLIITDFKMQGISGEQILHYVKNEKNSAIPVIGLSGTPWLLEPYNFDAIVPKPSSTKKLLAMIKMLLDKEEHHIDQSQTCDAHLPAINLDDMQMYS